MSPDLKTNLKLVIDGQIAVLTISNPRKRNALATDDLKAISESCRECVEKKVRVMIIRAEVIGGVWSSGHDISEFTSDGRDPFEFDSPFERAIQSLRKAPFPIIAMVQGTAWGGAVEIILSSDIVIADKSSTFAITPANVGLAYNLTGLLHFVGRLPANLIKEMFFTAAPIKAEDAVRWGIINHLKSEEEIEEFTMEMARGITQKAPLTISVVKEQLRIISDQRSISAESFDHISDIRRKAYKGPDYLEGLAAFKEKRQPVFTGIPFNDR